MLFVLNWTTDYGLKLSTCSCQFPYTRNLDQATHDGLTRVERLRNCTLVNAGLYVMLIHSPLVVLPFKSLANRVGGVVGPTKIWWCVMPVGTWSTRRHTVWILYVPASFSWTYWGGKPPALKIVLWDRSTRLSPWAVAVPALL